MADGKRPSATKAPAKKGRIGYSEAVHTYQIG